ncbi:MAG: molecular chaperone DnaJ, partial [Alphaproteobacteria bacterium]|nr:molecular chaperone DnaJ [Alphaproteobacteria bacterium]
FMGMFRSAAASFGGAAAAQESDVRSGYLRMTLEHGTGRMDGDVLAGTFAGRKLSTLARDDLLRLHGECRADPDSLALLEAFMDRTHPEWRAGGHGTAGGPLAAPAAMSQDEARRILGIPEGASEDDIKAAYRRLMGQMHPDKGGSDYLAAKVNQAKDILLKSK